MAEAVGPTAAAPAGYASDYSDTLSIGTDIAYDTGTPIDPRCVVAEEMDLSQRDGSSTALDLRAG
eukprot:5841895-Pyramimonas_sp.AAC.1